MTDVIHFRSDNQPLPYYYLLPITNLWRRHNQPLYDHHNFPPPRPGWNGRMKTIWSKPEGTCYIRLVDRRSRDLRDEITKLTPPSLTNPSQTFFSISFDDFPTVFYRKRRVVKISICFRKWRKMCRLWLAWLIVIWFLNFLGCAKHFLDAFAILWNQQKWKETIDGRFVYFGKSIISR